MSTKFADFTKILCFFLKDLFACDILILEINVIKFTIIRGMQNMKKRALSLTLVMCIATSLFTAVPITASAETTEQYLLPQPICYDTLLESGQTMWAVHSSDSKEPGLWWNPGEYWYPTMQGGAFTTTVNVPEGAGGKYYVVTRAHSYNIADASRHFTVKVNGNYVTGGSGTNGTFRFGYDGNPLPKQACNTHSPIAISLNEGNNAVEMKSGGGHLRVDFVAFVPASEAYVTDNSGNKVLINSNGEYESIVEFVTASFTSKSSFLNYYVDKKIVSGKCGENLTWTFDQNNTLTIYGTGAMWDYNDSSSPFHFGGTGVKSVVIQNGVTSIGDYAFSDCYSLTKITIPDSVTSIGDYAFCDCWNLSEIVIPNSVTNIGRCTFEDCGSLTSVTIGDSVTSIGSCAFIYCHSLTSITIPNSVTSIESGAFYGCVSLTSITIPNSVTSISGYAFFDCGLTSITIPDSVTSIEIGAFSNCTRLTSITIPDSVTYIGDYAFSNCGLTSITIPNSVTEIYDYAFLDCYSLTSITIPDSVTYIGDYAFSNCTRLTSITIPNSVTNIGHHAFYNTDYYNDEENWENNVLYIGKFLLAAENVLELEYRIKDNTLLVADYAFYNCYNLKSITIPDSVTYIGDYAFFDCGLTSITIPDSVTSIESGAFYGCVSLKSITIPNSVTYIDYEAFSYCYSLSSITIPDSVTYIDAYAFLDCYNLKSITIPDSVTHISDSAFYCCDRLTNVYYGGSAEDWAKIRIGRDNENLTNANIHYNYSVEKNIILSDTNISAEPGCKSLFVYKGDRVTPYAEKSFKVESSDEKVVTSSKSKSKTGNEIILSFNSPGKATVTVTATDGSGASAVCNITVNKPAENEETYLLKRLALCNAVYSNILKTDKTIEHQAADKFQGMFFVDYINYTTWDDFYKRYINDYKVIKLPDTPTDGFYAAAFESPDGNIVIAYRGSEGKNGALGMINFIDKWFGDKSEVDWWGTNLPMTLSLGLSSQFTQALDFYDDVKSNNPGKIITLTGHSLGGALASYVAINRGVRCDNVNGATGWLFNNEFLADPNNYPVNYVGFDEYVNENFNGHMDIPNKAVTRWASLDTFNYAMYEDTKNYNTLKKWELLNGEMVYVPEKNYHGISSIINYSDKKFTLTKKTKKFTTNGFKQMDGNIFLGTTKDDRIYKNNNANTGFMFAPKNSIVLCGDGDDVVDFAIGGDDTLIGNGGNDTLNGGTGNDTYVFSYGWGHDSVYDYMGKDVVELYDVSFDDVNIEYYDEYVEISCGDNSIKVITSIRKDDVTLIDTYGRTKVISCGGARLFSEEADEKVKAIRVQGSAVTEIYDAEGILIDTICVDDQTEQKLEYKDYGMTAVSEGSLELVVPAAGYNIKIRSDGEVSAWTVSDADNPTVAKQTFIENQDLSDGTEIVINTSELVGQQLSVKLLNGEEEKFIYSEAPDPFTITADKTEIKTGETITMSVPEQFADSVTWECANNNVIIAKNEDLTVSVIGYTPGEETVKAYLSNDELYTAEFSFEITEDSAPIVTVTSKDETYDGTETATDNVFFDVSLSDGYDKVVFSTSSPYSQIEDTNEFVVNSFGEHFINIYCENSDTGARTKAFTFNFAQDSEAPVISGVENEGVYYTDRVINVTDNAEFTVYVNGKLQEEQSFAVSEAGIYSIAATDIAGNTENISFEIKAMPKVADIKLSDAQVVYKIRNDFEEVKYSLDEERMKILEAQISKLEEVMYTLVEITDFTAQNTGAVNIRVGNAPEDAIVYVSSYNSFGRLLEVQNLTLKNGAANTTFAPSDVYRYKAFVWGVNHDPITNTKEFVVQ